MEILITEMGIRFGEVNKRLDRMDATLNLHGKQMAAGTKAIAGFSEWVSKADSDYQHVSFGAYGCQNPESKSRVE